jgi:hypothetical protein
MPQNHITDGESKEIFYRIWRNLLVEGSSALQDLLESAAVGRVLTAAKEKWRGTMSTRKTMMKKREWAYLWAEGFM